MNNYKIYQFGKSENLHNFNEIQELIQACAKVIYWAVTLLHKIHFEIVL